jgi:hypothetical protein
MWFLILRPKAARANVFVSKSSVDGDSLEALLASV